MNKLRQSLRRRKPAYVPEASRPHQWQADEDAVRKGTCSFPVRVSGRGSCGRGCGGVRAVRCACPVSVVCCPVKWLRPKTLHSPEELRILQKQDRTARVL